MLLDEAVEANPLSPTPPSLPPSLPPLFQEQIRAYVYDVVRATLPRMLLDEAFEAKDDIAHAIKASLQTCMGTYGYSILVRALPPFLPPSLPPWPQARNVLLLFLSDASPSLPPSFLCRMLWSRTWSPTCESRRL